jgi:hypothetical protein
MSENSDFQPVKTVHDYLQLGNPSGGLHTTFRYETRNGRVLTVCQYKDNRTQVEGLSKTKNLAKVACALMILAKRLPNTFEMNSAAIQKQFNVTSDHVKVGFREKAWYLLFFIYVNSLVTMKGRCSHADFVAKQPAPACRNS